jgi:hypothetical protein
MSENGNGKDESKSYLVEIDNGLPVRSEQEAPCHGASCSMGRAYYLPLILLGRWKASLKDLMRCEDQNSNRGACLNDLAIAPFGSRITD